jgi:hypothetical protein
MSRPGALAVLHQFKLGGRLNRKIGRLLALELRREEVKGFLCSNAERSYKQPARAARKILVELTTPSQ